MAVVLGAVRFVGRTAPPTTDSTTSAPTRPADVSPPAPATEKNNVPSSPAPPESTAGTEPRVDDLRRIAREQLARGERQQSLETIVMGLKARPDDAELKAMMSATLTDARSRLRAAHDAANKDRAAASRLPDYREAARRELQVTSLARSGRSEEAVRA